MPRETPVERFDGLLTEYESWLLFIQEHSHLLPHPRPPMRQYYKALAYMEVARPKYYRHQALVNGEPPPIRVHEYSQTPAAIAQTETRRKLGVPQRFDTPAEAEDHVAARLALHKSLHTREEDVILPVELEVELCATPQEGILKHMNLRDGTTDPQKAAHHQAVIDRLVALENENAKKMGDIL